ncbi:MAG: Hsp70 family protein [Chloroflexi bacterium]|nr:Hsp70 family protein [Chloroflexota bacterium]
MKGLHVGLDFGTSNSGVAVFDGRQLNILPLDKDSPAPGVIKTVLYITREYKHYIGQEAINIYYRDNIDRPRRFVKKWIGESDFVGGELFYVRDLYMEVDELTPGRLLQYIKTGLRSKGYKGTRVFDRFYSLEQIIGIYLVELKARSEAILGEKITGVTLGRPVHFFDDPILDQQSQETLKRAALQAGFEEVSFEYEPIAAALYYETTIEKPQNVLIFDFGGGTLDITIMRLGDPGNRLVYATGGIGIAGSDFDHIIIQKQMLEHFGKGHFPDDPRIESLIDALSEWEVLPELSTPPVRTMLQRTMKTCDVPARLKALESIIYNDLAFSFYNKVEAAKIRLSSESASLFRMEENDIHIWELLTRWRFDQDIEEPADKIHDCLMQTIERSGLDAVDIDAAIKTGGSSNIPYFSQMLERIFGKERVINTNTFSSVTAGLAVRAYEEQRNSQNH